MHNGNALSGVHMGNGQRVYVIDDDPSVRSGVRFLLATLKLGCRSFASSREFLDTVDVLEPGCILLDMRMPGPAVPEELDRRGIRWPILFMTGTPGLSPSAYCVAKPFSDESLLTALHKGFVALRQGRAHRALQPIR